MTFTFSITTQAYLFLKNYKFMYDTLKYIYYNQNMFRNNHKYLPIFT